VLIPQLGRYGETSDGNQTNFIGISTTFHILIETREFSVLIVEAKRNFKNL